MAGVGCGGMEKVNRVSSKANFTAGVGADACCAKGLGGPWALSSCFWRGFECERRERRAGSLPARGRSVLCPALALLGTAAAARQTWLCHLPVRPRSWLGHRQVSLPRL